MLSASRAVCCSEFCNKRLCHDHQTILVIRYRDLGLRWIYSLDTSMSVLNVFNKVSYDLSFSSLCVILDKLILTFILAVISCLNTWMPKENKLLITLGLLLNSVLILIFINLISCHFYPKKTEKYFSYL
jgi:hypothetical protein